MNIGRISITSILGLVLMTGAHAEGLCEADEAVIFNCELPRSVSSLCQSDGDGVLTYRNGGNGKINLKISDAGERIGKIFYFSNVPYAGGGEAHIRFSRSSYTYYLYDKTMKTNSGPAFSAGVVIYKDGKRITNVACGNDASIRERAYQKITKEAYHSIGAQ
ncbi:hypothetical protein [Paraburkholderia diazotrophica]|uniref:hypothetical protein n=1 Tax=Paraburkholderia diazotrophica TaxID=667676 RepID=UPI00115FC9E1|nr:hypothetical protein [Paraburkholderia diazotrophica]